MLFNFHIPILELVKVQYKAQVQVDQGPPYNTIYTETNKKESKEEPRTHGHRGNFSEQNTNSICSKIKN